MLQYNATQYFITEYDRVASTYPPNITLLEQAIKYNNQRVFDHLLQNTNMSLPYHSLNTYNNNTDVITDIVNNGNVHILQTYLDMTGQGVLYQLELKQLAIAINHKNEHFVRALLQHSIVSEHVFQEPDFHLDINMLRLLNEEFAHHQLLDNFDIWKWFIESSVRSDNAECVEYLLDHIHGSSNNGYNGDDDDDNFYDHDFEARLRGILREQAKYCCMNGYIDTLNVILQDLTPEDVIKIDSSSLESIIESGHSDIIKYLIDHQQPINTDYSSSENLVQKALDVLTRDHTLGLDIVTVLLDAMTNNPDIKFAKQCVNGKSQTIVPDHLWELVSNHPNVECQVVTKRIPTSEEVHIKLLLEAVKNNNISEVQLILPECDSDCLEQYWTQEHERIILETMSHEVGMLIASQELRPLPLTAYTLTFFVNEITTMSPGPQRQRLIELARLFISYLYFDSSFRFGHCSNSIKVAGVSVELMQLIHHLFEIGPGMDLFNYCFKHLKKAIKAGYVLGIAFLSRHVKPSVDNAAEERSTINKAIETGTLESVSAIFDYLAKFSNTLVTSTSLEHAIRNSTEVFEFVLGRLVAANVNVRHSQAVSTACKHNKLGVLKTLTEEHGCVSSISLVDIEYAAQGNSIQVLEYLLKTLPSSPFILNKTKIQRLRAINEALHIAYNYGYVRIIDLCHSIIKDINSNMIVNDSIQPKALYSETNQSSTSTSASSRISTAFHLVFRDRRVGMIIMRMIGDINRITYKEYQLIKGRQLLDMDSLLTYIQCGAHEWFIKSFNSVSNIYPHNSYLLDKCFGYASPDARNVDTLLANINLSFVSIFPLNVLPILVGHQNGRDIHPRWEYLLDELQANLGLSTLLVNGKVIDGVTDHEVIKRLTDVDTPGEPLLTVEYCTTLLSNHIRMLESGTISTVSPPSTVQVSDALESTSFISGLIHLCCVTGRDEIIDIILRYKPASDLPPR
ncbi:hypothetical protein SAMD00019534_113770 [Acytostelium subglobosum LB1]|uniref:hypothetical protein n=1 Tax=Acytostelium subglobosum LB1 TaxID=1410327 RepID=UPI000644A1E0|nr:hypothetical protein SAMD00019534_113770 [Acytostelium subglobosum LB1]GAM28201.1 hypothetical protein SAMD00019534_113770 [Acytostelium subglobosum LB1]|eukprot:XP_012748835.1 hypothetical protein SAMD00019534_113770 [Acytostelium subglobosum LB1]